MHIFLNILHIYAYYSPFLHIFAFEKKASDKNCEASVLRSLANLRFFGFFLDFCFKSSLRPRVIRLRFASRPNCFSDVRHG